MSWRAWFRRRPVPQPVPREHPWFVVPTREGDGWRGVWMYDTREMAEVFVHRLRDEYPGRSFEVMSFEALMAEPTREG